MKKHDGSLAAAALLMASTDGYGVETALTGRVVEDWASRMARGGQGSVNASIAVVMAAVSEEIGRG